MNKSSIILIVTLLSIAAATIATIFFVRKKKKTDEETPNTVSVVPKNSIIAPNLTAEVKDYVFAGAAADVANFDIYDNDVFS